VSAAPYIFAAIVCVSVSIVADKTRQRAYSLFFAMSLGTIGMVFCMASAGNQKLMGLTFLGLFLGVAGIYSGTAPEATWNANNYPNQMKRAFAIGIVNGTGNAGGIVGSNIFLAGQKPQYPLGFGMCVACLALSAIISLVLRAAIVRENKRRDLIPVEETKAKYTPEELVEMGDKSPLWRYVY
jgi:MFS family permease